LPIILFYGKLPADNNIGRRIGDRIIFSNVNLTINRNEKLGIVGVNGSGKSSLLDIIAGRESPDEGLLTFARDLRTSYLDQNPKLTESNSIIDELFSARNQDHRPDKGL